MHLFMNFGIKEFQRFKLKGFFRLFIFELPELNDESQSLVFKLPFFSDEEDLIGIKSSEIFSYWSKIRITNFSMSIWNNLVR